MRIALFGYGKMGIEIEKIAIERGHSIVAIVNQKNSKEKITKGDVDAVIEFSKPELAESHIAYCLNIGIPIVIGTTGWYNKLDSLTQLCTSKKGNMLHATNFSLGVNIFFELSSQLAKIMNNYPNYSASINEIHHTQKLDAPSGTGISLAEQLIANHSGYKDWANVKKSEIKSDTTLSIESFRLPDVPGTHEVIYESDIDKIEIKHIAHNRKGFALGSVIAAEWLLKNKEEQNLNASGVYTMKDVLKF